MITEGTKETMILVVDDNPTNVRVILDSLSESGLKTLVARNGESAIRQVKYARPDLILMDVMMPGIDGFETCRRLKHDEVTRDIPIIFMTALSETLDKVKGFEAGGVDYVTKPLQREEVLMRVQAHLEIRQLQKQLQEKNEQLRAMNVSKDKLFSIILDNLKSPITGLIGFTKFVKKNIGNCHNEKEIVEMVNTLQHYTENFSTLIENLFTWSKLQRGVIAHRPRRIDIKSIVEQGLLFFTTVAEQKHITLTNRIHEKTSVHADHDMVDMIIRNLLSNAIKFTTTGGKITLSSTQEEHVIKVSVSDTGTGIRQEDLSKLFRIDIRYQHVGTAGEEGTGLGLNLCKELVEKNGGKIWADSQIGKGSNFMFTLPKHPMNLSL